MWNRLLPFADRPVDPEVAIHWSAASSQDSAISLAALWLDDELGDLPHALYVRGPRGFEAVQRSGIDSAPTFPPESRIAHALGRAGGAVATRRSHRGRRFDAALSDADREVLRGMGAEAVVPLSPTGSPIDVFVVVTCSFAALDAEKLLRALTPIAECLSRVRIRTAPSSVDWRPGRAGSADDLPLRVGAPAR